MLVLFGRYESGGLAGSAGAKHGSEGWKPGYFPVPVPAYLWQERLCRAAPFPRSPGPRTHQPSSPLQTSWSGLSGRFFSSSTLNQLSTNCGLCPHILPLPFEPLFNLLNLAHPRQFLTSPACPMIETLTWLVIDVIIPPKDTTPPPTDHRSSSRAGDVIFERASQCCAWPILTLLRCFE